MAVGGRPRKQIDLKTVAKLASCGCTVEEIAATLEVGRQTLYDRKDVQAAIAEGKQRGRATLRAKQWEKGMSGDTTMLIWLGKQVLGQRDKHEFSHLTDAELLALATGVVGGDS